MLEFNFHHWKNKGSFTSTTHPLAFQHTNPQDQECPLLLLENLVVVQGLLCEAPDGGYVEVEL